MWLGHALYAVGLAAAACTAFYMFRAYFMTFHGPFRGWTIVRGWKEPKHAHGHGHDDHAHHEEEGPLEGPAPVESPPAMTIPLIVLAVATMIARFLGSPFLHFVFADWVHVGEFHAPSFHGLIALIGSAAALGGIAIGVLIYRDARDVDPMQARLGWFLRLLQHRFYVDDLYMGAIVLPVRDKVSAAVYWFNQNVLDGVVNGAAAGTRGSSSVIMWIDRNVIDGAVNGAGTVAEFFGRGLRTLQSGKVQWYAVGLFAGVIALAAFGIIR
jgi:NADH-quinone oxidoreductase subunit L